MYVCIHSCIFTAMYLHVWRIGTALSCKSGMGSSSPFRGSQDTWCVGDYRQELIRRGAVHGLALNQGCWVWGVPFPRAPCIQIYLHRAIWIFNPLLNQHGTSKALFSKDMGLARPVRCSFVSRNGVWEPDAATHSIVLLVSTREFFLGTSSRSIP